MTNNYTNYNHQQQKTLQTPSKVKELSKKLLVITKFITIHIFIPITISYFSYNLTRNNEKQEAYLEYQLYLNETFELSLKKYKKTLQYQTKLQKHYETLTDLELQSLASAFQIAKNQQHYLLFKRIFFSAEYKEIREKILQDTNGSL